ncbi:protein kinase domain-containing protein [Cryptosporidium muris RN66]|uniref:Protein kinase domain-containing protein n=1 Tax=Cryptosporidium muris (strain RN66) TaxID=441375 RepID=B6AEM9_CRYMR|nr:protein kinase domain-containing protein [Cryptosporidium muris RN66]EEA06646.1 protein kinase domain-containing protein [Cryptosporidium muris RN66]|eukprot:XP_002140995.1 protein kinase domain-containing protein [Cryptosporidium muris RN66]
MCDIGDNDLLTTLFSDILQRNDVTICTDSSLRNDKLLHEYVNTCKNIEHSLCKYSNRNNSSICRCQSKKQINGEMYNRSRKRSYRYSGACIEPNMNLKQLNVTSEFEIGETNSKYLDSNIDILNNVGNNPYSLFGGCFIDLTRINCCIEHFYSIGSLLNSNKKSVDKEGKILQNQNGRQDNLSSNRPQLYWAYHKATGFPVVIKIVKKSRILSSFPGSYQLWRNLCMKLLSLPFHPNVMKIFQVLEDETNFYLIMEGLEGGELFQFLVTEQAIPEETCKYIIRQILESVNHLHCLQMLHRDVKPENLMFRYKRNSDNNLLSPCTVSSKSTVSSSVSTDDYKISNKEDPIAHLSLKKSREYFEVVLVDFDTCQLLNDSSYMQMVKLKKRLVGTFGYLAPEVLNGGEYSTASDLWSIGIILYILMTGIPPLRIDLMCDYNKALEVLKNARDQGGFQFNVSPLPEFPLAQDLCIRLLQWDPNRRIRSCQQALKHPWLLDSFKYNPIGPIYQRIQSNCINITQSLAIKDEKKETELKSSPYQQICLPISARISTHNYHYQM